MYLLRICCATGPKLIEYWINFVPNLFNMMNSKSEILNSCILKFRDTQEFKMLFNYLSRESRLNFEERMALTRTIEQMFEPVFMEMKNDSPSLSESDLIYCILVASGFDNTVIADCISISKDSLRMRKIRVREKLASEWNDLLFPDTATSKCDDNVAQHLSATPKADIILPQNQSNDTIMETKKISFGQAVGSGWKNCFRHKGRASRTEFWYFILFDAIVVTSLWVIFVFSRFFFRFI